MGEVAMPLLPPGGLFEIVFSFDTTGSMSRAIEEIKGRVQDMIQRLQADIPGIRIGVIAHGDYCDKDVFYLEKHVDLSNNVVELCDLVKEVEGTGGGDPEECYEYILRLVSGFSWTPGSQKALVMIGDATPHEPEYDLNVDNLDWRKEAARLADMGIKMYGVQAFDNEESTAFFDELITIMPGQHLQLGQFSNICDLIMAICYREKGGDFLEGYEAEVRARERRMNKDLEGLFGTLRRGDSSASAKSHVSAKSPSRSRSRSKSGSRSRSRSNSPMSMSRSRSRSGSRSRSNSVMSDSASSRSSASSHIKVKKAMKVRSANLKAGAGKPARQSRAKRDKEVATQRNIVRDSDFVLQQGNLKNRWSNWKLAISDTEPKSTRQWVKRSGPTKATKDKLGWRRKQLFPWEPSNARVMYEIAVQAKPRGKMHVVYCKWSTLNADQLTWERRLLKQRNVQDELESVLNQGCKVFVRRFETRRLGKNQKKSMKDFRRLYKYSWPALKLTVKNSGKTQKVVFT